MIIVCRSKVVEHILFMFFLNGKIEHPFFCSRFNSDDIVEFLRSLLARYSRKLKISVLYPHSHTANVIIHIQIHKRRPIPLQHPLLPKHDRV